MFWNVVECTSVFLKSVVKCLRLLEIVGSCSRLFEGVVECCRVS